MSKSYTLILTKGIHSISATERAAIVTAIQLGDPLVDVRVDLFGAEPERLTTIVTAHVVAITEIPAPADIPQPATRGGKVTQLRRPRTRRPA